MESNPQESSPRFPGVCRAHGGGVDETTRLRIQDPGDLIALVPYLVGFLPEESLVAVWLAGGQVALTGRVDIGVPRREAEELVARMRLRVGPDADVVLLAWTRDARRARRLVRWVAASLPQEVVIDRLLCDGERWWSLSCRDPRCCPKAGHPVPFGSDQVAAARAKGLTAARSREDAVAVVAGPVGDRPDLDVLVDEMATRVADMTGEETADLLEGLVAELVARREVPDEAAGVELAVLASCSDLGAVQASMLVDHGIAHLHADVWERVVQVAPRIVAPGALAVLGIAAWVAGRGALTTECCRRLEREDPEHPLLPVLAGASIGAWPPSVWDQLRGQVA